MILKVLVIITSALLVCSGFGNAYQFQRAVAIEHKTRADALKATVNAYVAASVLSATRQRTIDAQAAKAVVDERDSLARIVTSKDVAIKELRRLKNEKPFPANCRVDVERVRSINKKLSSSRRR
jgi:hypothetical protein